jgi:hypothetical protein
MHGKDLYSKSQKQYEKINPDTEGLKGAIDK